MNYVSTRGGGCPLTFQDAVLAGQAEDGGLLVPEELPDLSAEIDGWRELGFVDVAFEVIRRFAPDIDPDVLRSMLQASFATFQDPDVLPVVQVGDLWVLELFHGPTLAFKDVALQVLGRLFEHILEERQQQLNVLAATSGDTGSAAIAAVRGRRNLSIFVMFPDGKTSRLQELQMTTVLDNNVHCIGIEGSFDDCQRLMKTTFDDLEFKSRHHLGAMNSINWARLVVQMTYYVYASLRFSEPVNFSVPTGNFGNILSGILASRIGAPIRQFILSTNENDILQRFFSTGRYELGRVHHSISPSMDIQVASNLERFLYFLFEDTNRVATFMDSFARTGSACLDRQGAVDSQILATRVDTESTTATIERTWRNHGYLLDPHSAVGVAAVDEFETEGPTICLATAHPAKFPESVNEIVGQNLASHPMLQALDSMQTRKTILPPDVDRVKSFVAEKVAE